jgi:colanic acid biosynthesis glycosyl transferase WcaI
MKPDLKKVSIHTMYFLPEFGSAPILMNELSTYLAGHGHRVEVMTTIPRPPHHDPYRGKLFVSEKKDGFVVKRTWTNVTPNPIGRLVAWTVYTLATFLNLFSVRRGDVLFLRLPPLQLGITGILGRLWRGAPFVLNVQDIHPDLSIEAGILKNPLAIKLAKAFEKWTYEHSPVIVVISEGFKNNLLAKGVPGEKIRVVPNWVDTDFLRPRQKENPVAQRLGLDKFFTAMYSGTISISSNTALERVLEAARILEAAKDIKIAIVGEGLKKRSLEEKAAALGLKNVVFFPFQPYEDLPEMFSASDILLVPLDREKSHLSVPSKLYNFMAAGRPILGLADGSSEVAGLIGSTECGICAEPDDPRSIARAILRIKNAPSQARRWGLNGRKYAETTFGKDVVLRKYEELIESL